MSSDRKHLLRSSGDGPGMRNLPLFAFLAGLVFIFYMFYVYQAQSAEITTVRESLDISLKQLRTLKADILNARAENERLQAAESSLKSDKEKAESERDSCNKRVQQCLVSTHTLEEQKKQLNDSVWSRTEEVKMLKSEIDKLKSQLETLKTTAAEHENSAKQSKEALQKLEAELNELKASKLAASLNVNRTGSNSTFRSLRSAEVGGDIKKQAVAAGLQQAPPPIAAMNQEVESELKKAISTNGEKEGVGETTLNKKINDEKEGDGQIFAPPQKLGDLPELPMQPGDRVKLAVAEQKREDQQQNGVVDKPVVKGGDYDDKLDAADRAIAVEESLDQ
ncbi:hypothetical protein Q1695_008221 [Nippostrongylus brasiliensis]|nr:hypothetical protein Q1695_008221 [Nippostrongylus brasiliensis]